MKTINSYSIQFKDLIEIAYSKGEHFIEITGTPTEIRNRQISLRTQIYGFLKVIRQTAEHATEQMNMKPPRPPGPNGNWALKYYSFAEQTGVKIERRGGKAGILLYPKKKGVLSMILENSFQENEEEMLEEARILQEKTIDKGAEESLRKLQAKLTPIPSPYGKKSVAEELEGPLYTGKAISIIPPEGE